MNRTLRVLALPLAVGLLLAACGSPEPDGGRVADGPTVAETAPAASDGDESNVAPSDGGVPMDNGGDAEAADESDAWPEVDDGEPSGPFSPDGATGGTLDGSVYTLGAPEELPADVVALIVDAGYPEKDLVDLRVLPVQIDNSQGSATESVYAATAVIEGGEQYAFTTLGGYLIDVAQGYADLEGSGMGDPVYDALWDRGEAELKDVAPTAEATVYVLMEGLPSPDEVVFTYFALEPPMHGEPIPMAPID